MLYNDLLEEISQVLDMPFVTQEQKYEYWQKSKNLIKELKQEVEYAREYR